MGIFEHAKEDILVIADIGINHGGDVRRAESMIRMAEHIGCNGVKLQHYVTERFLQKGKTQYPHVKNVYETFEQCELDTIDIIKLQQVAESLGLYFAVSLLDDFSAIEYEVMAKTPPDYIKIPYPEIKNFYLADLQKHLSNVAVISAVWPGRDDINRLINFLSRIKKDKFFILECPILHPAPAETYAFRNVEKWEGAFLTTLPSDPDMDLGIQLLPGISNHSTEISLPIAAMANGARMVECHLKATDEDPDASISLDMHQLKRIIKAAKAINTSIYPDKEQVLEYEKRALEHKNQVAKVFVTMDEVQKGDKLLLGENVNLLRPAMFSADYIKMNKENIDMFLAGCIACRNIKEGTALTLKHIINNDL